MATTPAIASPSHHHLHNNGAWKACPFILWYNMIERICFYGISSNLTTYLTNELCEGTAESARNVNNWLGVGTMVSIIGAFVADACFGQFRVIAIMSITYILGLISLTLLVVLRPFKHVECDRNSSVTTMQAASFYISLYLISIGSGSIRPCLTAFGADQFHDMDPKEKERKSSFFNWLSFTTSTGCLISLTIVLYIQDNVGWGTSFGIITGAMLISVILFLAASPWYRSNPPNGSPFISIVQVLVATARKWNIKVPNNNLILYEKHDYSLEGGRRKILHTNKLRFLDKAATMINQPKLDEGIHASSSSIVVEDKEDANVSAWELCSVTQVEEVKLIATVIPIWVTTIVFSGALVQIFTLFVKQGTSMDRHITSKIIIPAASLLSISMIVIIVLLPMYESLFVPIARRLTGEERGITVLQRIGVGMFLVIMMMVAAAMSERKRLHIAQQSGLIEIPKSTVPITIFWLFPQYFLYGTVFVFGIVGQQEFFYDQVPDTMRNMGMALLLCALGLGNFFSSILITLVDSATRIYGGGESWFVSNLNKCHLDYFYWLLAVLCSINLFVYLWAAHSHVYKKV